MSLSWTPEMKALAKDGGKALVKFQAQLKHCGGGNYTVVGPFSKTHAMAMLLLSISRDEEKIHRITTILKEGLDGDSEPTP